MSSFHLHVKSTLDYQVKQLALSGGLTYIDLDGDPINAELMQNDDNALAWSLIGLSEAPRDPMYSVEFEVGGKTVLDPARYQSLDIAGLVQSVFSAGKSIQIMDYSGASMPTVTTGVLVITGVSVVPQQTDRTVGLRLVAISGRVVKYA